jgi:hypothetical protein
MAPYSMDLRTRVVRDSDAGMPSKEVAAKYSVSLSWVNRVKQRQRETGEIAPAEANEVSGTDVGRTAGIPAGRVDYGEARCDTRRIARRAADDGGAQHAVAHDRPLGSDP